VLLQDLATRLPRRRKRTLRAMHSIYLHAWSFSIRFCQVAFF
jgi:hypothetical protein